MIVGSSAPGPSSTEHRITVGGEALLTTAVSPPGNLEQWGRRLRLAGERARPGALEPTYASAEQTGRAWAAHRAAWPLFPHRAPPGFRGGAWA